MVIFQCVRPPCYKLEIFTGLEAAIQEVVLNDVTPGAAWGRRGKRSNKILTLIN